MTFHQIFLIVVAVLIVVALPIWATVSFLVWLRAKPSDRSPTRGGSMGGVLLNLDRFVRPSVEHRIEMEHRVVKEEADRGGA